MKVSPATRLRYAGMPSAFTLIELMVVLALIGILSAVLLPEMRGSLEEVQLRSNARKLAEACDVAFSRSVATGRILHLDWDPTRGSFHVIQDPEDSPSRRGSSSGPRSEGLIDFPGASGTIDPRITVNLQRLTSASAEGSRDEGRGRGTALRAPSQPGAGAPATSIEFRPDGTADASEFVLQDRAGFRLSLRLNPVTSRLRIMELPRL